MPCDKPVILVANHQNAMLDPVLICLFSNKQLHWLTRADLFKKLPINKLLRRLNMLPVYRDRDRVSDLAHRNQATFEECYERLKGHAVVSIFPEGTHRGKKQLVPLKKGLSRLILGATEAGVKDLVIQPVGLDYQNYYEYRKTLVINFGNPLNAKDLLLKESDNLPRQLSFITEEVTTQLKSLMVHIDNDDVYQEIMALQPLAAKITYSSTPGAEFDTFKLWSDVLDKNSDFHPWLNHDVAKYRRLMHDLRIQETLYRERFSRVNLLALFAGIPFLAISFAVFYPIYFIAEKIVDNVVRDPLFRNSIRLVIWTFLTPIVLLFLFFLIFGVVSSWLLAAFAVTGAVLSGLIALSWIEVWKLFRHHSKCESLAEGNHALFTEWKNLRKDIIQKLKSIKSGS
jgi:1-acyl-sn-glycerol-3-phosphate acyltransferase